MEKKRKVLHVLQSSKYSGAENVACTIIKMFNQASDNIIFFYTSPNGKIKDVLNKKNIKYLPMEKLTYFKLKRLLMKLIRMLYMLMILELLLFVHYFINKPRLYLIYIIMHLGYQN